MASVRRNRAHLESRRGSAARGAVLDELVQVWQRQAQLKRSRQAVKGAQWHSVGRCNQRLWAREAADEVRNHHDCDAAVLWWTSSAGRARGAHRFRVAVGAACDRAKVVENLLAVDEMRDQARVRGEARRRVAQQERAA